MHETQKVTFSQTVKGERGKGRLSIEQSADVAARQE